MMRDPFERIKIGDEAEIVHTITEKDIEAFAQLTGDNNPLHMSEDFALQTTFRKRVVHGMLTASFISTIIGTKLPGEGALWYEQHLQFLTPVRVGEKIKVKAQVKHKSPAQRIITLSTTVFNEQGKKVINGEAKVKIIQPILQEKKMLKKTKGAVIISGAGRGIGAAVAKVLAENGYPVVINYSRSEREAKEVVRNIQSKGGKAIIFQADISERTQVDAMITKTIKEFGVIFGVVNNASLGLNEKDFLQLNWEEVQQYIDVQIKGAFNICQGVMPSLLNHKEGCIVNIASIVSDDVPPVKLLPYTLTKATLVSLTRCLAAEFGPQQIRVNCVSPGMTITDMVADISEKVKIVNRLKTPLRRLAQPEDIAHVVSFLFSEKASHVTGETIRVCGGQTMM